jgi:rubredoxin
MNQASSETPSKPSPHSASALPSESNFLTYQDSYICPVCRHGQISAMTLMDAFACNFCRHIFTANLPTQSIQVVDSSQPMSWRWNGRKWQSVYRDTPSLTLVVWLIGIILVTLPGLIVWLASALFPPLPTSTWSWFPKIWVICTFGIHLLMVSWLLVEHYQLPLYVSTRIRVAQWFGRH